MSQLPLRLDWLWFCGYDIDDPTPDHSVISKARRCWGEDVFVEFFANVLNQCINAGLVDGEIIHVDSSMIDGNASKDSLKPQLRKVSNELYKELEGNAEPIEPKLEKRVSTTDPDARFGKKYGKVTLGYKDHRAVDDKHGIVTATLTTPTNVNDEKVLTEVIDEHQSNTSTEIKKIATDKIYGTGENYKYLYEYNITPCISHKVNNSKCHPDFNHTKFTYNSKNDCYICPAGKTLEIKHYNRNENAVTYIADRKVCQQCQYFKKCVASKKAGRQVQRNINKEYIDWADNCLTKSERKRLMTRRKYKAEGSFADAANNHGFKRMRYRGIEKAKIQNLMIAAIQNLRKLMRYGSIKAADKCCNRLLSLIIDVNLSRLSRLFGVERVISQFKSEYSIFKERLPKKRQFIILFKRVAGTHGFFTCKNKNTAVYACDNHNRAVVAEVAFGKGLGLFMTLDPDFHFVTGAFIDAEADKRKEAASSLLWGTVKWASDVFLDRHSRWDIYLRRLKGFVSITTLFRIAYPLLFLAIILISVYVIYIERTTLGMGGTVSIVLSTIGLLITILQGIRQRRI